MPTDAELRSLFREAAAPPSSIDTAAVIRRSKRRRLPQQLGAGSVLTLAVAGIGVAGFTGLRGIAPMSASETVADAPRGVAESGPFAGADSAESGRDALACAAEAAPGAPDGTGLELAPHFPSEAVTGRQVVGALALTNTSTAPVEGTVAEATVTVTRNGEAQWYRNQSTVDTRVAIAPGESVSIDFSFAAVECDARGNATGDPLAAGDYTLSAELELLPGDGTVRVIGGAASVISLR